MNGQDWGALALLTVKDPPEAARRLMGLGVSRDVLWLALLVVSLLNTLLLFGPAVLLQLHVLLPGALAQPVAYAAMVTGGLFAMIFGIHWVGTKMGGTGSLDDVAVLFIWMQALRVGVQAVSLVLQFVFPLFNILLAVVVGFYSLYIVLHFIDQAHRLESLGRAAGVFIATLLALVLALAVLLTLVGGPMEGMTPNV